MKIYVHLIVLLQGILGGIHGERLGSAGPGMGSVRDSYRFCRPGNRKIS